MYLTVRLAYAILGSLPLSALQSLGRILGSAMYYLLSSRRHVAFKNCEVMGITGPDAVKTVKSSFRHTFSAYMESFYSKNITQDFLEKMVDVEFVEGKPFEDRGYFMVSAHFGGWELSPYLMTGRLGLKGAAVARKIKDQKIDEFLVKQRKTSNVDYIHHRGATDSIKEYVDKGLSVGVLLDHSSMPKDSMSAPLFGVETTFIKGIPLLAVRKNYPVLPIFVLRKKRGFQLVVYPAIWPDRELPPKERARDMAVRINKVYEDIISKHPDQWYLIHKRFKRVTGEDGKFISGIY